MRFSELKQKLKPIKDFVAFIWVKPERDTGLILPQLVFDLRLEPGRYLLGKVIAVGPQVKELKEGQFIIFSEYGMKNYEGTIKEDWIYFIRERDVRCRIENPDQSIIDYRPPISKREIQKMQES